MNKKSHLRTIGADIILGIMFLVISWLYLILTLNDTVPTFGLIILGALWALYAILSGRVSYATPLDFPILALLASLPLSLWISIDWYINMP